MSAKTQTITITNDFHGTSYRARAHVMSDGRLYLSEHQVRRIRRALCQYDDCICGGYLGERGDQDDAWVDEPDVDTRAGRIVGMYLIPARSAYAHSA